MIILTENNPYLEITWAANPVAAVAHIRSLIALVFNLPAKVTRSKSANVRLSAFFDHFPEVRSS